MAALTCVFFHSASLMIPVTWSFVVALGAALGSQIWSTASRGLWAHTWLVLLVGLVADSLLTSEHRRTLLHPMLIGTPLAWSYFVRPTASPAIAATTIYGWLLTRGSSRTLSHGEILAPGRSPRVSIAGCCGNRYAPDHHHRLLMVGRRLLLRTTSARGSDPMVCAPRHPRAGCEAACTGWVASQ